MVSKSRRAIAANGIRILLSVVDGIAGIPRLRVRRCSDRDRRPVSGVLVVSAARDVPRGVGTAPCIPAGPCGPCDLQMAANGRVKGRRSRRINPTRRPAPESRCHHGVAGSGPLLSLCSPLPPIPFSVPFSSFSLFHLPLSILLHLPAPPAAVHSDCSIQCSAAPVWTADLTPSPSSPISLLPHQSPARVILTKSPLSDLHSDRWWSLIAASTPSPILPVLSAALPGAQPDLNMRRAQHSWASRLPPPPPRRRT